MTAGVAMLRAVPDGVSVQWMSAGHPAPIVLRKDGTAERWRGGGIPLGIRDVPGIARSYLLLAPGETLLMYTDGLTESRNATREMFEEAALWEALRQMRDASPEILVRELSAASAAFGAGGADDIAVLAIRAKGHGDG